MTKLTENAPAPVRGLSEPAWSACNAAAKAVGLEPELVRAVCWVESRGGTHAVSKVGALGLMQLMPATAQQLGVHDVFDAHDNALGGAKYLGEMLVRFGSIDLMLAAYNWGPGNVDRVKRGERTLPLEVEAYVTLVRNRWEVEKQIHAPFFQAPPLMAAARASVSPLRRSPRSGGSDGGEHE